MFSRMMNDNLTIFNNEDKLIENIKGSVQENNIYIMNGKILIEDGDFIKRKLSNGSEEVYEVIDNGFKEKFGRIPSHYQMTVEKVNKKKPLKEPTSNITNNYHINSDVVQIGNNNIVNYSNEINDKLIELKNEIKKLNLDKSEENDYIEIVDEIKEQFNQETPKKSIVKSLINSLSPIGSASSILNFLLKVASEL